MAADTEPAVVPVVAAAAAAVNHNNPMGGFAPVAVAAAAAVDVAVARREPQEEAQPMKALAAAALLGWEQLADYKPQLAGDLLVEGNAVVLEASLAGQEVGEVDWRRKDYSEQE